MSPSSTNLPGHNCRLHPSYGRKIYNTLEQSCQEGIVEAGSVDWPKLKAMIKFAYITRAQQILKTHGRF
jgi:hypothetical protein